MAVIRDLRSVSDGLARTLRAHREARGWSLGGLAERAGLSKTILSRIEAGTGNPSVETLWRIAGALDLPLGTLLGEGEPPATRLVRADEGELVESAKGLVGRLLLAEGRAHRTEAFELMLSGGADYRSEPHPPGTEELVICIEGTLLIGPNGQEVELAERDALWFPADVPHRYASEDGAGGIVMMSYPPAYATSGSSGREEEG